MNPLLPPSTHEGLPTEPVQPKPDPRRNFEAHVREPYAPVQIRSAADALAHDRTATQLRGEESAVPLGVHLAMAGMSGRIYPQGLRATGYLSMLASDRAVPDAGTASASSSAAARTLVPDAMPATSAVISAASVDADVDEVTVRADSDPIVADEKAGAPDEAAELRAGTAAAFTEWARRMVRLSDGTATLWIRDYRLDATQQRSLVEQLHSFARDTSTSLKRIVFNGDELWREGARTHPVSKEEPHGR